MLRFYGDQLRQANPDVSLPLLTRSLVEWLDFADDGGLPSLEQYKYPSPEERHPVGAHAQTRKIRQAQADAGDTPVYALAHGYGPLDDFQRRLTIAHQSGPHGIWVNRYAYLSDAKLDIIGQVAQG